MQALNTVATGHLWQYRVRSALGQLAPAEAELKLSTELFAKVIELQKNNVQARRDLARNALYSSALNARIARQPGISARERAERRQRAVSGYEHGQDLFKTLDAEGAGTAADAQLIQETGALVGRATD